jgi:two-component system sensor histidine kinase YesM
LVLGDTKAIGNPVTPLLSHINVGSNNIKSISLNGQTYLVNEADIPQLGWKFVQLMNQENFVSKLDREKNKSIGWVVAWFLLFAIAFIFLMIRFTGPFKHLVKSMNRVGKGEFNTTVQIKGQDEVAL